MLRSSFRVAVAFAVALIGSVLPLVGVHAQEKATSSARTAERSRAQLLTFEDLEKRLNDPTLRLIDCRARTDYEQGHIPGAVWIDMRAFETRASQPGGLEDRKFWEDWVAPLGIDRKTSVFVYDAKRQLDAARVWFFLRWIGVERSGLINGGYPLWAWQNRPITTAVPQVEARPFKVEFRKGVAATREDVLAAIRDKSARVVDARSDAEFAGTDRKSRRGGHIPAACHLEWTNLVDQNGTFLDRDALTTAVEKSGLKLGNIAISHCQSGGRASVTAFALELLGVHTRIYFRGWSDWGNAEETPVVEGDEPGNQ
jgi:thiosulfate/3-mercaptopyruvate sulfurtransferase